MLRVDIGVKISHNVDVLQSTEEGNFKSSGAAVDQLLRKLLLKADVSVRLPAHKGDPGVAHSLIGASERSEGRIERCERFRRDALRRGHFFRGRGDYSESGRRGIGVDSKCRGFELLIQFEDSGRV